MFIYACTNYLPNGMNTIIRAINIIAKSTIPVFNIQAKKFSENVI